MSTTKKHAGIKSLRQSIKNHAKNLDVLGGIEVLARGLKKAQTAKDAAKTKEILKALIQAADKAMSRGVVTKNKAARIKSRAAHLAAKK